MPGNATLAGRAFGAMFFSVFGSVWLAFWAFQRFAQPAIAFTLIALGFVTLFYRAFQQYRNNRSALAAESDNPARKRISRLFNLINGAQWIVIVILVNILNKMGLATWAIPAAMLIIGIHFLPLAKLFAYPPHYVTGVALIVAAISYPLLAADGPRDAVGGLAAGLILWASAVNSVTVRRQVVKQSA